MAGYDEREFQALIAALAFIAAADGRIDAREVAFIRRVIARVFGFEVTVDLVRNYAHASISDGDVFLADLSEFGADLSGAKKMGVYFASALLSHADGEVDARESAALEKVAGALGLGDVEADAWMRKAADEASDLFRAL